MYDSDMKSTPPVRQVQHVDPIWRGRSDFIIAAEIDPSGSGITSEQLWARQISAHTFEICCIPFFVYNLALGDTGETDDHYVVNRVVGESGRFVFRVILTADEESARRRLVDRFQDIDARLEWYSNTMASIDVPTEEESRRAAEILWAGEQGDDWAYETGKIEST